MAVPTAQDVLEREQTLDPSAWEALARRDGEAAKAHAVFLDYVLMGPRRIICYLYASCVKQPPQDRGSPIGRTR